MRKYSLKNTETIKRLSKYPMSVFRLFGYITNYYAGAFNPEKAVIDRHFISNVHDKIIHNKKEYLIKICSTIFIELKLENALKVETTNDDFNKTTQYTILSDNICEYLLSTGYKDVIAGKKGINELFIGLVKPTIGIFPTALLQRLEFIIGCYFYHQTDNEGEWIFYNNYEKAKLIYNFMFDLAEESDII